MPKGDQQYTPSTTPVQSGLFPLPTVVLDMPSLLYGIRKQFFANRRVTRSLPENPRQGVIDAMMKMRLVVLGLVGIASFFVPMWTLLSWSLVALAFGVGLWFYFLPVVILALRVHKRPLAPSTQSAANHLMIANLLLGWTGLGWIVMIVVAIHIHIEVATAVDPTTTPTPPSIQKPGMTPWVKWFLVGVGVLLFTAWVFSNPRSETPVTEPVVAASPVVALPTALPVETVTPVIAPAPTVTFGGEYGPLTTDQVRDTLCRPMPGSSQNDDRCVFGDKLSIEEHAGILTRISITFRTDDVEIGAPHFGVAGLLSRELAQMATGEEDVDLSSLNMYDFDISHQANGSTSVKPNYLKPGLDTLTVNGITLRRYVTGSMLVFEATTY
jgi:hypothetical protein